MAKKPGKAEKAVQPKTSRKTRAKQEIPKKIEVSGQVRNRKSQAGIVGIKVEVWHKRDRLNTIMIRAATTAKDGNFHLLISELDFKQLDLPPKLNLFFKLYRGGALIKSTEDDLIKGVDSHIRDVVIEVDLPGEQRVFIGKLHDNLTGNPLVGYTVSAKLTDTDPDADLGSAITSCEQERKGEFTFVYLPAAPTAPSAFHLDLTIRDQHGREALIPNVEVKENELFEVRVTFPNRLSAGKVGGELLFDQPAVERLFLAATTQNNPGSQLWAREDSELLVFTAKVAVELDDGLVLITIPVSCGEAGAASIQVPFVVGSKNGPAGMVVATEERLRGPELIVDAWGESLTAFAWQIFLTVAGKAAAESGVDEDGAGLIPAAITASPEGLRILPMARHGFDRVRQ